MVSAGSDAKNGNKDNYLARYAVFLIGNKGLYLIEHVFSYFLLFFTKHH